MKERHAFTAEADRNYGEKGKLPGNYQHVVSIKSDCDNDSLVVEVIKDGPACHTGAESCFSNLIFKTREENFSIQNLYNLIKERKTNNTENSYTSYLFEKGLDKILKKIGEECTEVIIGAKNEGNEELIYELADLVYHSMVLMIEKDITLTDIKEELRRRQVVDKKVKQEKMK